MERGTLAMQATHRVSGIGTGIQCDYDCTRVANEASVVLGCMKYKGVQGNICFTKLQVCDVV